jgi:pyrimidine operon attenuation protein/uracil phosphoribosyltransferase
MPDKTLLLNKKQIEQRINRIAYQIYEDNYQEKEIFIVGILNSGYALAEKIETALNKICDIKTHLVQLKIDKLNHIAVPIEFSIESSELKGKVVILVDDVLNSGKTLIYGLRKLLNQDLKKIRTVLLVDRDHKRYPIMADFVGITLSTTLQEHISVEFGGKEEAVYLS